MGTADLFRCVIVPARLPAPCASASCQVDTTAKFSVGEYVRIYVNDVSTTSESQSVTSVLPSCWLRCPAGLRCWA